MAIIDITLFGACAVRVIGDETVEIRGSKHRALFALLATAPMGRRSRAYLQETLWGSSDYESGHQNLRRALSDLRKLMGAEFDSLLDTTMTDVQLSLESVRLTQGSGEFLNDLNVRERGFTEWVSRMRASKDELAILQTVGSRSSQKIRPVISALPLTSPDADPALSVLGDWVAEEICRTLSRSNLLTVISHLSGRNVAGKMISLDEVRHTLGIDFLITGAIRRQGQELILDFDFIDAGGGKILWNYNMIAPVSQASEALIAQVMEMVANIGRSITEKSLRNIRSHPFASIENHEFLLGGVSLMHSRRLSDFLTARRYLDEAVKRVPEDVGAHAWLGKWHVLNVMKGYTTDCRIDAARALARTEHALKLDPDSSFALTIDGFVRCNLLGQFDEAEWRYSAALDRNHSESLGWLLRAALLAFQDRGDAAIKAAETARHLSPIDPFGYYFDSLSSTAYLSAGKFELALDYADRSLLVNDRHISTLRAKITAQYFLGDADQARETALEMQRKFPLFSLAEYRKTHPSVNGELGQRVVEALSATGMF